LSSVTALVDFTRENGATVVVPGSHRWEPGRQPEDHELAYAEMPAGATVIYRGSTIHGGGANSSDTSRPGLHVSYVAGWLRPEENNTLATPLDVARLLPRRAQDLIGYDIHDATSVGGGFLGCVDLGRATDTLLAPVANTGCDPTGATTATRTHRRPRGHDSLTTNRHNRNDS
jgi:hypothetical protein